MARLAAVQAIYQIDIAGAAPDSVLQEFIDHRLTELAANTGGERTDKVFLADLVRGVSARVEEIDELIAHCLTEGWVPERLDGVLRAILRCGTYELLARLDVPTRVVINEYIEVAHDFFEDGGPGFINAVLDSLARRLRSTDQESQEGDDAKTSR